MGDTCSTPCEKPSATIYRYIIYIKGRDIHSRGKKTLHCHLDQPDPLH